MTKTIREVLEQLQKETMFAVTQVTLDKGGVAIKIESNSFMAKKELEKAFTEISHLLDEVKPSMQDTRGITQSPNNPNYLTRRSKAFNEGVTEYSANIERILK